MENRQTPSPLQKEMSRKDLLPRKVFQPVLHLEDLS